MPDLNEELLTLLNGPGPQYINKNNKPEWARGSDGAPHMKIVDSNGNPLSTIKTQDDNVENRLQAIENKLDSVIENGAFKSQLTGSNVDKVEYIDGVSDLMVPDGSTVYALESIDVSKYKEVFFQIRPGDIGNYKLRALLKRGSSVSLNLTTVNLQEFNSLSNTYSDLFEIRSIRADFGIENTSGSDGEITDLYLFGRL